MDFNASFKYRQTCTIKLQKKKKSKRVYFSPTTQLTARFIPRKQSLRINPQSRFSIDLRLLNKPAHRFSARVELFRLPFNAILRFPDTQPNAKHIHLTCNIQSQPKDSLWPSYFPGTLEPGLLSSVHVSYSIIRRKWHERKVVLRESWIRWWS